jgi:hypothetical protein
MNRSSVAPKSAPGVKWGLDTETQDGRAVLIAVSGPQENDRAYLPFPESFADILTWLSGAGTERFVCYNMDYDARALMTFLPKRVLRDLFRHEYAKWRGHTISYLVGKEFSVTGPHRLKLYDCCVHFQKSLKKAYREVFHEEGKDEIPRSWFSRMGQILGAGDWRARKIIDYCIRDSEAVRRLWSYLDVQYRGLGISRKALDRPLSPGQIAADYFGKKIRFPRLPAAANYTAKRAYRGGRIEVYGRGYFPRVHVYDLKSAYPWALSTLPDPRALDVVETEEGERPGALYSVYWVRVEIPETCLIPPLPKFVSRGENDNVLVYPAGRFASWITGPELALVKKAGFLKYVGRGIHLEGERRPWLTEIPELFALRKSRPEISQAVKLVLNSIYGKLAQTRTTMRDAFNVQSDTPRYDGQWVARATSNGPTSNFFVASYVTALVRCRLWETMREAGFEHVLLGATDGIVLEKPLPHHRVGKGALGDWVPAGGGSALVVGTGVYSIRDAEGWHDKVRGFRPLSPLRDILSAARSPRIRIKNRVAYTLGDWALKGSKLNEMVDIDRTLDVNFDVKRRWPKPWRRGRDLLHSRQTSLPLVLLET